MLTGNIEIAESRDHWSIAWGEYGLRRGALHLWVETSNLNVPGIRAYRRMRFELCGADTTLYLGTPAANEQALFFALPLVT